MQSYYMQVKEFIAPKLKFYIEDLTEHDRKALKSYSGEFLHASRNSGTDLILFDKIDSANYFEWAATFALRSSNDIFLHGHNGKVKKISRERAIRIATAGARVLAAREARAKFSPNMNSQDDKDMRALYSRLLPDYLKSIPAL